MAKIAIVGSAPSSRMLAPFGDKSWTIWACSPDNQDLPRFDAWFQLHPLGAVRERPDHYKWLAALNVPVYLQAEDPAIRNGVAFPKEALVARFGPHWFSSTVAWMMAYALSAPRDWTTDKLTDIAIYGVDMAHTSEYEGQRLGVLHFTEVARAAGVRVSAPQESSLFATAPMYAYDSPMTRKLNVHVAEITGRVTALRTARDEIDKQLRHLEGSLEAYQHVARTWS